MGMHIYIYMHEIVYDIHFEDSIYCSSTLPLFLLHFLNTQILIYIIIIKFSLFFNGTIIIFHSLYLL
jgi:hypothetical protein